MPQGSKKTRDRQLARLYERRRRERLHKHRQRLVAATVGILVALGGVGGGLFLLAKGGKPKAQASGSPTPSANASPGANCGYTAKQESTGGKSQIPIPTFTIDVNKGYTASVKTSMGTFTVKLLPGDAPCAVNSFVYLAKRHFFDGLTFHRIVKDFVIQGGDPAGNGSGGPGYTFNDELANTLKYEVGSVAMANSGPNTSGSQWFVVTGQQGVQLPKKYAIFGKVTRGLDVVLAIGRVKTKGGTGADAEMPVKPVYIVKVTIKVS